MRSIGKRLSRELFAWYRENDISLESGQVLALSGGSDSVALLYLLSHSPARLFLKAAYFNHNLRSPEELNREIFLIRRLCGQWEIPLIIGEAPENHLKKVAAEEKRSLEEVAREERYAFLEQTRLKAGAGYLVLAHHQDDQLETLMTRFFQGSGLSGLAGISPVAGTRIRPLLGISKKELSQCLMEEGIPWSTDITNGDKDILRNRIRDRLIPAVEECFPGYSRALEQFSRKIERTDKLLDEMSSEINWTIGENGVQMPYELFASLAPALRERVLFKGADLLLSGMRLSGGKGRRIPGRFFEPLLKERLPLNINLKGHGILVTSRDKLFVLNRL